MKTLPLAGLRVLDLASDRGFLCGKILGEIGADVIKIELPGGEPSRRLGPFYHDALRPESSLSWFALNTNKRGITLNLESADGREIFRRMAAKAHFVVESFDPGYLDAMGLGYKDMAALNPGIIVTSITPYGQTGPYSHFKGSDLSTTALSGFLYLVGDADRPPVRISFPQAYLHAGLEAAAGTMVANCWREMSGEGQHVDVSIQRCLCLLLTSSMRYYEASGRLVKRVGISAGARTAGGNSPRSIYPTKDGYFDFCLYGGAVGAHSNREMVKWMADEGMAPPTIVAKDWDSFDMATASQEELDEIAAAVGQFFLKHDTAELYEGALKRGIMAYPVNTVKDIAADPQLKERDFWVDIEHEDLGATITYPGSPLRMFGAETPMRRAPLIGEHNEDIYAGELGFTEKEMLLLKQSGTI